MNTSKKTIYLIPSKIEGMITGTTHIEWYGKKYTAVYEDGLRQTAHIETAPESYSELISLIQSKQS